MIPRWARLAYQLGRFGKDPGPQARKKWIESNGLRSLLYLPVYKSPIGAWLISPGLHLEGPADRRLDRLARILASIGYAVLSPAVPDLMALRVTQQAIMDVGTAFRQLHDCPELPRNCRPAVLGTCVGAVPALHLAASTQWANSISAVVTIGAYADPEILLDTLVPHDEAVPNVDPLNRPVLFLTLLDHLPGIERDDRESLATAWRDFVRLTWSQPQLKKPGSVAHYPIARALSAQHSLSNGAKKLFLIGCGVLPGGHQLCRTALRSNGAQYAFLDPRPLLPAVSVPVYAVHGRDDAVIPLEQLYVLTGGIPSSVRRAAYVTALFRHSEIVDRQAFLRTLPDLFSELSTMRRILETLANAAYMTA